jgi:hypothetical protein
MSKPEPIGLSYATPESGTSTALKIVAWIFIATGILTIIQTVVLLTHGQINFDTGVLGVLIGPGLLRFSRGWRTCALVLLWLGMILGPINLLLMLSSTRSVNLNLMGIRIGSVPLVVGIVFCVLLFALTVWEYRVLVREEIRRRFGLPPR